ncbi:hypothetical protein NUACC26_004110 [Scytonema sp. NUACC26]
MEGLKVPKQLLRDRKTPKVVNPSTHQIAFEGLFLSIERAGHGWKNIKLL